MVGSTTRWLRPYALRWGSEVTGVSTAYVATLTALSLVYCWLTARVILLRRRHRVGIGDGERPDLARAIRVHGNFAEWVPLTMIALGAADLRGAPEWLIALLGAVLVLARVSHADGLTRTVGASPLRTAGVAGTITVLLVSCVAGLLG